MKRILGLSLLAAALAACDDSPTEPKARLPGVGEQIQLNVQFDDNCEKPLMRAGRVAAVSSRAIMVHDASNPTGGFSDADYQEFAAAYDNLVWPVVTRNFGEPEDIDRNDRVVFFVTKAINDLTSPSSGTYINGLFFSRDLFPTKDKGDLQGCPSSNVGEVIYLLAPDPGRGGAFSLASARQGIVGVMAHETQHLISASRRLYTLKVKGTEWNESVWLNEGLSHVAEELVFYQASGLSPRRNLNGSAFPTGSAARAAYFGFMAPNVTRYFSHAGDPGARLAVRHGRRRGDPRRHLALPALRGRPARGRRPAAVEHAGELAHHRDDQPARGAGDGPGPALPRLGRGGVHGRRGAGDGAPLHGAELELPRAAGGRAPAADAAAGERRPGRAVAQGGRRGLPALRGGAGRARCGWSPEGRARPAPARWCRRSTVGQVHTLPPAAGQALCVDQPGDYTLVAFYGADVEGDALGVDVTATGIQAVAATPSPQ
jgi:hypothetical protein